MVDKFAARDVDVLVVGSGAGGLTAALAAAKAGARVLIVEKSARFGGTSATSGGGVWIPCSCDAARQGHPDDKEAAYRYLKTLIGDDVPEVKIRTYVDQASRMLDWVDRHSELHFTAIAYADYHAEIEGARDGYRTHDPEPVMADRLGASFADLEPSNPMLLPFGRFAFRISEGHAIINREPGYLKVLLGELLRYATDFPWLFRQKRSRRLTVGNAVVAGLKVTLDQLKVPLELNMRMRRLIRDGDGRVAGAIVEKDGHEYEVRTRTAIILASGGFDHDAALRAANLPETARKDMSAGVPTNTGDALRAGEAVGAATKRLDSAWWAPGYWLEGEDRARPMFVERAFPYSLIVDQTGNRYVNEAASYHIVGGAMVRAGGSDAARIPSWFIFDGNYRRRYMFGPVMPGRPAGDSRIPAAMRAILKRADSLDDLAAAIAVDPVKLRATIDRFNAFAHNGRDEDFGRGDAPHDRYYGDPRVKPNPNLGPIARAPFYAVPIHPCDIGTNGGLDTDERARVLDRDGKIIPGLYATGNCAASVMGRTYPGAGATLGPAMTFGWIAARDAMRVND